MAKEKPIFQIKSKINTNTNFKSKFVKSFYHIFLSIGITIIIIGYSLLLFNVELDIESLLEFIIPTAIFIGIYGYLMLWHILGDQYLIINQKGIRIEKHFLFFNIGYQIKPRKIKQLIIKDHKSLNFLKFKWENNSPGYGKLIINQESLFKICYLFPKEELELFVEKYYQNFPD